MNPNLLSTFAKNPSRFPKRLAREFPHVFDVISLLWGNPEMGVYFDRLLLQDRDDRRGFPAEVVNEVFALREFHDTLFPQLAQKFELWQSAEVCR